MQNNRNNNVTSMANCPPTPDGALEKGINTKNEGFHVDNEKCLLDYAANVLKERDLRKKAALTIEAYKLWEENLLPVAPTEYEERKSKSHIAPEYPGRPLNANTLAPGKMKSLGKGRSQASRIAMVHSFAHIESYAIDLSWDIILRFHSKEMPPKVALPKEFYGDWLKVAWDEARHFTMWADRLLELGSEYGTLPVHDGLWQSAMETKENLLDRLAIIHMVHEARGLDVTPKSIAKFNGGGDKKSAALMNEIYIDEITHVEAGVRWFKFLCEKLRIDPIQSFHEIVRKNFRGNLKPPFNTKAREDAGFTEAWYLPLVSKKEGKSRSKTSEEAK